MKFFPTSCHIIHWFPCCSCFSCLCGTCETADSPIAGPIKFHQELSGSQLIRRPYELWIHIRLDFGIFASNSIPNPSISSVWAPIFQCRRWERVSRCAALSGMAMWHGHVALVMMVVHHFMRTSFMIYICSLHSKCYGSSTLISCTSHFSSHDFIRFNWNNSFQLLHWHVYCLLFIIFYHHIDSYHIIYIHLYIWYSTIFVDWFDPKIHFHLISHLRLLCNIVCIRNCILTIVGYIPIQSHQPLQVSIIFMAHIFSLVVHRFLLQPTHWKSVCFLFE